MPPYPFIKSDFELRAGVVIIDYYEQKKFDLVVFKSGILLTCTSVTDDSVHKKEAQDV